MRGGPEAAREEGGREVRVDEVRQLLARIQEALIYLPDVGAVDVGEEELVIRVNRARAALKGERAI